MIPKIIHYCWFGGGEIPERDKKCIESWKRVCPDYEIIRWDESNYDVSKNKYMRQAYEAKKWGFVPDYARLDIVFTYGGIYLDTDVEIIKSFDELLENKAYMGFEKGSNAVAPGLGFGAEKNMPLLLEMMEKIYGDRVFKKESGELDLTPSPTLAADFLCAKGIKLNGEYQKVEDMVFYPADYFCPIDYSTNLSTITDKTFSIHHFHASWQEPEDQKIHQLSQLLAAKYGAGKAARMGKILFVPYKIKKYLRTEGVKWTLSYMLHKLRGD